MIRCLIAAPVGWLSAEAILHPVVVEWTVLLTRSAVASSHQQQRHHLLELNSRAIVAVHNVAVDVKSRSCVVEGDNGALGNSNQAQQINKSHLDQISWYGVQVPAAQLGSVIPSSALRHAQLAI